ncbi:hypothetical protein BGX28_003042 [Mortierella sp. GBA30]|nr:hypothetical protein BGX28_003042 [Mortierella sp. GBA30]
MFELADYVQAFSYNGIVRKLEVFRPASGGSKEDRDFVLLEDVGDHFDITGVHFVREDGVFLSFTRDSRLRRHVPERIPACRGSTIHIIPNTSKEQSTAAIYSSPPPSSSSLSSSSSSSSTVTTTQHAAALSNSEPAFVDVSAISWQPKCQTSSNNSSRKNPHGSMPLSYLQAACLDSSTSTDDSIAGNGHDAGPEGKEEHDAEISGSNHSDYASSRYSRSSSRSDSVSSGLASPASINTNLPDWVYTFHRQQPKERYEDGRTRHMVDSAPYMLPNDLSESDRLEAQHYIVRYCFQGNYNVRLDHDATKLKILDVATGTGVWALEMAHEFPMADIYGVDISPLYPIPETSSKEVPPNCHFQLCNVLDGLPFPDNYFDFVYQRLLVYAFTQAQRKQVNAEVKTQEIE